MLSDFAGADKVYIACGYTDLRRAFDLKVLIPRSHPDNYIHKNAITAFIAAMAVRIFCILCGVHRRFAVPRDV